MPKNDLPSRNPFVAVSESTTANKRTAPDADEQPTITPQGKKCKAVAAAAEEKNSDTNVREKEMKRGERRTNRKRKADKQAGEEFELQHNQGRENDEHVEREWDQMGDLEFRKQLLSIQAIKASSANSHLSKFKKIISNKETELEARLREEIELIKSKRASFLESIREAFQMALSVPAADPTLASLTSASPPQNPLHAYHEKLNASSAHLLKQSLMLNTLIRDTARELVVGETWEKDAQDAMEVVKAMRDLSEDAVKGMILDKTGGWASAVEKEKKSIGRLLKRVPVTVEESLEQREI